MRENSMTENPPMPIELYEEVPEIFSPTVSRGALE